MNPNVPSHRNVFVLLLAVSLVAGLTACNVDGLARLKRGPDGPRASMSDAAQAAAADESLDMKIVGAKEVDLVEQVVAHRAMYHRALEELRHYYEEHGYATKERWAAFELGGLKNVRAFSYLLDAEIPSYELRPTDRIKEADALYDEGIALMKRGGHGVPALYRQDLMVEALKVFKGLIERYPTSDKIDDAAFYCGEISKEYLPGQETIAVKWYERSWTWNPATEHPARFQAAVVYDYRLHDRDRALELYHAVVGHEEQNKSNVRFAARRIHELTSRNGSPRSTSR